MKLYLLIILSALLLITSCTPSNQDIVDDAAQGNQQPSTLTIEITSTGFNPSELTINQGDTVTWINKDSTAHWPASVIHPTHNAYPETGGCIGSKFDACKELATDDSWDFTFNAKGSWNYHDHLDPKLKGKIIVE